MPWNYRLVRKRQRSLVRSNWYYDIHEVYYTKKGRINGWTLEAILGGFDSASDAKISLAHMLADLIKWPVVEIKGTGKKQQMVVRKK